MAEISVMPFTVPFLNNARGAAYSSIPFFSQQEIADYRLCSGGLLPCKSVKFSTPFLRHWRMDPQ